MTRFALEGKCGGPEGVVVGVGNATRSLRSNEAKAAAPRPSVERPRNCRRVVSKPCSKSLAESGFGDGFIEVQDQTRHRGVSSQFRDIELGVGLCLADLQEFARGRRMLTVVLVMTVPSLPQNL